MSPVIRIFAAVSALAFTVGAADRPPTRPATRPAGASLPAPAEVTGYALHAPGSTVERPLTRESGDALLTALRADGALDQWMKNGLPAGIICVLPLPTTEYVSLRLASGKAVEVGISGDGGLLDLPGGLFVPTKAAETGIRAAVADLREQAAARAVAATRPTQYTVGSLRDGGTLSGIARLFYDDARQWKKIYAANRDTLSDPDKIRDGMVLTIP
jgi:hypothetical protein